MAESCFFTMNFIKSFFLYLFYAIVLVFFFLLFIDESPYRKYSAVNRFKEIFSVGWNFFTQDPRTDRLQIFFYKDNKWQELGKTAALGEQFTRISDALQMEIVNYANPAPDSLHKVYPSAFECLGDTAFLDPYKNHYQANKVVGRWLSKEFIVSNYGNYFLLISSKKMPWAWLNNYSQKKMKCRSLVIKL